MSGFRTLGERGGVIDAVKIRYAYGHRFVTDPSGDDRCLGCGWDGAGLIAECRPATPRCEPCRAEGHDTPADVLEFIGGERFDYCAAHRLGLRVPELGQ